MPELHDDKLYDPWFVADLFGYECKAGIEPKSKKDRRRDRVYSLAIRKTRIGPNGGKVMYRGRDIREALERMAGKNERPMLRSA